MKHTLTEQKVLKRLNIPDFRHMTKDKIVEFSSMLYRMDPEVAKKALEQIPEYVKMANEMVHTYKQVVDKVFESNKDDTKAFYDACNSILETLKQQLEDTNITSEERNTINEQMIMVARMIGDKGAENKQYNMAILKTMGQFAVAVAVGCLSIFGVKIMGGKNNLDA